ncbi:MAG: hypothetical protein R3D58_04070 [Saprospiraceae bacterium]
MKILLTLSIAIGLSVSLSAQTLYPCPIPNGPGADHCQFACLACNLDGLTGNTSNFTGVQAQPYCVSYENDQWFAFIAGATSGTFTATPSNCTLGNGLQIALTSICYGVPIACNPGAYNYGDIPVSITASLTPGQVYYLMIDGFVGDHCDFVLSVSPGAVSSTYPVDPVGPVSGQDTFCFGLPGTISVDPVNNAGFYIWTAPPGVLINGYPGTVKLPAPGNNAVEIQLTTVDSAQVCVEAGNSCSLPLNSQCKTVYREPLGTIYTLPDVFVCSNDLPYELPWGGSVSASGIYDKAFTCDSIVRQKVIVRAPIIRFLPPQTICAGDSVVVCGQAYKEGGSYTHTCTSYLGCDSLINFSVLVLEAQAKIVTAAQGLTCAEPELILTSAPAIGTKRWLNMQGEIVGTGDNLTVSTPGFYFLQVNAMVGPANCSATDTILIKQLTEPPPISAAGGTLTPQSPWVILQVHSLFSNVSYAWTGPAGFASSQQNPAVSVPGMYTVTVTDLETGCTSSATVDVIQG